MSSQQDLHCQMQGEQVNISLDILNKYNVSGPRYTSYPTAPEWKDGDDQGYLEQLGRLKQTATKPLSIYTHLPFCEERCHFCGCNTVVTKQKEQAEKYLGYLLRELDMLKESLGTQQQVSQYHWGGGTPTYFSVDQIQRYFNATKEAFNFSDTAEISIETDPRVTSVEHLAALRELGFNRISYGVQSFDPVVQAAINRVQPYDMVKGYYDQCRSFGYDAVNFDLIYGLPAQTLEGFKDTVKKTIDLGPDRIALYSFAFLPQILTHQKRMDGTAVLQGVDKFKLFLAAIELFTANGYRYIGLDHFAKDDDELAVAEKSGTLHRNFMGHTTKSGTELIALGVSAISMFDEYYVQNEKKLSRYYASIEAGRFPVHKALGLSKDDRIRRDVINALLCNGVIDKDKISQTFDIKFDEYFTDARSDLDSLKADGLFTESAQELRLTMLGRLFNRNVSMAFDYYIRQDGGTRQFSKTI